MILLLGAVSCTTLKNVTVVNRLDGCITQNDIDFIKKKINVKGGYKLYINKVEFDTLNCIGLFRLDVGKVEMSAGYSTYALKLGEKIKIQSKSKYKNEQMLREFFTVYSVNFTEASKKYIWSIFSEQGVGRGR